MAKTEVGGPDVDRHASANPDTATAGSARAGTTPEIPVDQTSPNGLTRPGSIPAESHPTTLVLFGIPFHDVTEDETLAWIAARGRSGQPAQIVTSNLDFILQAWRDPEMHRIHFEADLVIADGWPPVWFSRFFGPRLKARVAGADLVPRLGAVARANGLSLYALGGMPGVGAEAMRILQERNPGLRIAGSASPPVAPLLEMDHAGMRRVLREACPDILLVAFGAPKQDKWIRMNSMPGGGPVAMGVGGSLDFIVGTQCRAPAWIRTIGMEWFWRLASQPRRLFKRYSSNLGFLAMMVARLVLIRFTPGSQTIGTPPPDPSLLRSAGAVVVPLAPIRTAEEASAFCHLHDPTSRSRLVLLDLSAFPWLNSLELGVVARLAREARRNGGALFLSGVSGRVRQLIRLFRLDRYVEVPDSPAGWGRRLGELSPPHGARATRWDVKAGVLQILLPEEFEREEAWTADDEFVRREAEGAFRSVVVDGHRLRYIDSSGLRFLRTVWLASGRKPGGAMSLRAFPESVLAVLRQEGLGSIPIESAPGTDLTPATRPARSRPRAAA